MTQIKVENNGKLKLSFTTLKGYRGSHLQTGGAVYGLKNAMIILEHSTLRDHFAHNGAAIYATDAVVTTMNTSFINNSVSANGGAVYATGSSVISCNSSVFTRCKAANYGAAAALLDGASIHLTDSKMEGGLASNGGAISSRESPTKSVTIPGTDLP